MEIDNKLDFSSHNSNLCKRINNQFNVILLFRKLIPRDTLLKLTKRTFYRILTIVLQFGIFVGCEIHVGIS